MSSWKVGDKAIRKGRECEIIHIDQSTVPVSLTVRMLDDNNEVGTEFSRISKIQLKRPDTPVINYKKKTKPKKHRKKKKYEKRGKHHSRYCS